MAAKFLIQSVQRQGYEGSYRAGRKWASKAPTLVEIVDADDDPTPDPAKPVPHLQIGKKSFEAIKADPTLRVLPEGDPLALARASDDVVELRAQIDRLTAENERLKGAAAKPDESDKGGRTGRRHE